MKAVLKALAAAALVIAAVVFVRSWLYEQYRCQIVVAKDVRDRTHLLATMRDSVLVSIQARENLHDLAPCLERSPWNVRLQMLAGGNHAARGDHKSAADAFARALEYDRRPETYFALGEQLMHLGQTDEAVGHLVTAAVVNPTVTGSLPEPVRSRVDQQSAAIRGRGGRPARLIK